MKVVADEGREVHKAIFKERNRITQKNICEMQNSEKKVKRC